ncbi:acid-sensing ion channel 4-A-like [Glandiceps talaboti]
MNSSAFHLSPTVAPEVGISTRKSNYSESVDQNETREVQKGNDDDKDGIRNRLQRFSQETSMHGLHYIGSRDIHRVRRFIYAIIVAGTAGWLLSILYLNSIKYASYLVSMTLSLRYQPEMMFPAVTVCNYNRYRKSYINGSKFEEWQGELYDPKIGKGEISNIDWTSEDALQELSKNRTEFEINAAHSKEGMIWGCQLGTTERNCSAELNFTTTYTDFGVCYTYNGLIGTSPEDAVKVKMSGSRHGFSMFLYLDQSEYSAGEHLGAGFKILLHHPGEVPLITDYGIAISPGTETFLSTSLVVEKNQQAPYITDCKELELQYYSRYSKSNCIMERITDEVASTCNCTELYMEGSSNKAFDPCPVACDIAYYDTYPSYAKYPGSHILDYVQSKYNLSSQSVSENSAYVHIYFRELSYMYIEQVPAYDGMSFLGDFGGQMGLCLGASLLSAFECIEFILISILKIFKR